LGEAAKLHRPVPANKFFLQLANKDEERTQRYGRNHNDSRNDKEQIHSWNILVICQHLGRSQFGSYPRAICYRIQGDMERVVDSDGNARGGQIGA
jgi:hypothetical protein